MFLQITGHICIKKKKKHQYIKSKRYCLVMHRVMKSFEISSCRVPYLSQLYEHADYNLSYFCLDIDECKKGTDKCRWDERCINTRGSFTCRSCGFGLYGDGTSCRDFDECAEDSHDCHQNAKCINTWGSYRCCCLDGYHGNGRQCKGNESCRFGFIY